MASQSPTTLNTRMLLPPAEDAEEDDAEE